MAHGSAAPRQGREPIKLFRVFGIQISLDYSWFIVFALVFWSLSAGYFPREFPNQSSLTYWTAGLVATVMLFFSILVHELSHSLMAIHSGLTIREISLFLFGGVSRITEEAKDPLTELKIALVGPVTSLALSMVFRALQSIVSGMQPSLTVAILGYLAWINLALAVFNLMPGFPLDGGRALRAILWWKTNSLTRATKWAADIGKGFSVALIMLGGLQIFTGNLVGGLWIIFIGMFLRIVAEGGYQEVVMRQCLEDVRVEEVMTRNVVTVPPHITLAELVDHYFMHHGYRGFPVSQDGKIIGVVSLQNLKGISREQQQSRTVGEILSPLSEEALISPEISLADAMKKMVLEGQDRLLVMRDDTMIGMITKTGLLRFLEMRRILER